MRRRLKRRIERTILRAAINGYYAMTPRQRSLSRRYVGVYIQLTLVALMGGRP